MEFIVITLASILVSAFVFYLLANNILGFKIGIKSLLMCAGCAIVLSLLIPRVIVSYAGFGGTLGILVICAMIFAYLIAYYDKSTPKTNVQTDCTYEEKHFSSNDTLAKTNLTYTEGAATLPATEFGSDNSYNDFVENNLMTEMLSAEIDEVENKLQVKSDAESEDKCYEKSVAEELPPQTSNDYSFLCESNFEQANPTNDALSAHVCTTKDLLVDKISNEPKNAEMNPVINLLAEKDASNQINSIVPELSQEMDGQIGNIGEAEQRITAENMEISVTIEPSVVDNDEFLLDCDGDSMDICNSIIDNTSSNIVFSSEPSEVLPDTLDELLEIAFKHKENENTTKAIAAFTKALKLYPECDVVPFLIIEIGTLQKNAGNFDAAINTFSKGRQITSLQDNDVLQKEFIEAIAYLRIIKNILIQNKIDYIRFQDIPADILQQIDEEFAEWRNLVNII